MEVLDLYVYPIKSLGGIRLMNSKVTERGLELDRRWMLVDKENTFMSQRKYPEMAKLKVEIESDNLIVTNLINGDSIKICLGLKTNKREIVNIWDDKVYAEHLNDVYDKWFSTNLNKECRLFFQPEDSIRKIDERYFVTGNEHTSLSDGYPILIISEESVNQLNTKLEAKVSILRFRPNIVIRNSKPHEEDDLQYFEINNAAFQGVKPCARCNMTLLNPETLEIGTEPLKTLNTYRKSGNKILFGQNVVVLKEGFLSIGDKLIF